MEQYQYAYNVQQSQPVELRQPLAQIYLEQGFFGLEHLDYCLKLRQQYIAEGYEPEFDQSQYQQVQEQQYAYQEPQTVQVSAVTCKVCLSECQSDWTMCPFCGNNL
ncbi:MAG: hypothetical protein U0354_05770 [Candidatus Sericytochromatia bacterium]